MRTGLIGKKLGSSSYFHEDGERTSVTLIKIDECIVSAVKTKDVHGYNAVQIASIEDNFKLSKVNKAQRKLFTLNNIKPKRVLKEFRVDENNSMSVGDKIDVTHFNKGQLIDVSGISIGKGFAGSMKRHNFAGGRASHGVSVSHRSHGSTGNSQDPGKVFKGKKMAGHMGSKNITKQNLKIIDIDTVNNLLIVKGSVPGKRNSVVLIKEAIKKINKSI